MLGYVLGKKSDHSTASSDTAKQQRYETLVRTWHKDLYRYAFWLVKDQHIAEDLVQETCLRAWRSLDSLQDDKAAKSWLITILRRENARRFERKQLEIVPFDEQITEIEFSETSTGDTQQLIYSYLMQLPPQYREPLALQVMSGFSGDEIAQILDLNKNTVMTRLFRARNQLKELMDKRDNKNRGNCYGRA